MEDSGKGSLPDSESIVPTFSTSSEGLRLFVLAGPGDCIGTYRRWMAGRSEDRIPAVPYSQQMFEFADEECVHLRISPRLSGSSVTNHPLISIVPIHGPRAGGVRYMLSHLRHGLRGFLGARTFDATAVIVHDDLEPIGLLPFLFCRCPVYYELHCAMWPRGAAAKPVRRLRRWLSRCIVRLVCTEVLATSEECRRQVAGGDAAVHARTRLFLPSYRDRLPIGLPVPTPLSPLRVLSAGRVEEFKGVFDIVEAARRLEISHPGEFRWSIAGDGPHLEELRRRIREGGLESVVETPGRLDRQALIDAIAACHLTITPTRNTFAEGLAQLPLESVIIGRPALVSNVVPAFDHLQAACLRVPDGDPSAIADAILDLRLSPRSYESLCEGTRTARQLILDETFAYKQVLRELFGPRLPRRRHHRD